MTNTERAEWLIKRQRGIGGSDIGAICGLSKYKSRVNIFIDKTQPIKEFSNKFTLSGQQLEPFIADYFAEKTGLTVNIPSQEIYQDIAVEYFLASIDREIGEDTILEIKSTRTRITEPYRNWEAQLQWYLSIRNKPQGVICWIELPENFDYDKFNSKVWSKEELEILKLTCKIDWRIYRRDEVFIEQLRNEAHLFWNNHVLTNTPPDLLTAKDVLALYPEHISGLVRIANEEILSNFTKLKSVKEKIKELELLETELSDSIKIFLEDGEKLTYDSNVIATFKSSYRNDLDTKALKEAEPEIYSKYKRQSIIRTLRLKS